jgi:hypothetical protein
MQNKLVKSTWPFGVNDCPVNAVTISSTLFSA